MPWHHCHFSHIKLPCGRAYLHMYNLPVIHSLKQTVICHTFNTPPYTQLIGLLLGCIIKLAIALYVPLHYLQIANCLWEKIGVKASMNCYCYSSTSTCSQQEFVFTLCVSLQNSFNLRRVISVTVSLPNGVHTSRAISILLNYYR